MIQVIKNGIVNKEEMLKPISKIRTYAQENLSRLDETHLRLKSPHTYIAGLEKGLFISRNNLRKKALAKSFNTHEKN